MMVMMMMMRMTTTTTTTTRRMMMMKTRPSWWWWWCNDYEEEDDAMIMRRRRWWWWWGWWWRWWWWWGWGWWYIMIVSVEQRPGSTEHVKAYLPNVIFSILHGKVRLISQLWMIQSRFLDELPRSPNVSCFRNLNIFFMTKSPNIRWTLGMNGFFSWQSWRKMVEFTMKNGGCSPEIWQEEAILLLRKAWSTCAVKPVSAWVRYWDENHCGCWETLGVLNMF